MVSPYNETARDTTPAYDLADVYALASKDSICINGDARKTLRQFAALGLPSPGEEPVLCKLLLQLQRSHFVCSVQYDNKPTWLDVYVLPKWRAPNGDDYSMFVKFKFSSSGTLLTICSCHPEGWS